MPKKLIIVPSRISHEDLVGLGGYTDILAVTPEAMLALDISNIHYITPEDFYPVEEYRKDLIQLSLIFSLTCSFLKG